MSLSKTVVLGLIAGATILIGLPIGRVRRPMPGTRAFLNATAIGVLLFIVWDVLAHAWDPIDHELAELQLERRRAGNGDLVRPALRCRPRGRPGRAHHLRAGDREAPADGTTRARIAPSIWRPGHGAGARRSGWRC